ncbi:MAG TPA: hypothetical protein VEL07_01925, partial [Planctomycetota bacterium]|nr:hypothetical protein [Planctomycetota bacterium]
MTHRILPSMLLLACAAEGAEVGVDDLHATFAIDGRDAGYHARWVGRDGDQVVVDALTVMRLGDADLRMAFQIRLDRTAPGGWRSFWYDDGERMTEAGWSDDGCVAGVDGDVAPFAAAADSIPTWAYFLPLARLERRAGAEVAYTRLHESLDAREPARLVCDRREATGWEVRLLVDGQEASAFRIDDGGGLLRAHWNGPVSERVAGWAELVPRLPEEVRAAEADYDAAV